MKPRLRATLRDNDYKHTARHMQGGIILFAFFMIVFSQALSTVLEYLLLRFGLFKDSNFSFADQAVLVGSVSVIIGMLLSFVASRLILKPFYRLLNGMSRLSAGRYGTRLPERKGIYHRAFSEFNSLAKELESVEILRSDFINNFSHEFKTPLVSMQGLVGLMKNKKLPEQKQKEYLSIIEVELKRLSMMTTNVLHMTKLDAQSILTDVTEYNLSEQLRTCLLMLEKSWTDKRLDLGIEGEEVMLSANEDLLKQVWLNLLDNAIKHSPRGGELGVSLKEGEGSVTVRISNLGPEIPEDEREKIFSKFYQSDRIGEKKGNGIGLSVVKRILLLHGGDVRALREGERTVFEVTLPKS